MEKLKYLVGYLPFKVNVSDGRSPFELTIYNFSNVYRYITEIYLRPLSDLTKEIEVNGEKFVPCEELLKIRFKQYYESQTISRYQEICFNSKIVWFQNTANYNLDIPNYVNINKNSFDTIQKLLEWHFDIYGLIEQGLAIDINTLNK